MHAALTILPVILLIVAGHLARRWNIIAPDNWPGVEQLGFRLLFPAILLTSVYRAELSPGVLAPYLGVLLLTFAVTGIAALLMRRPLRLTNPRLTSHFQGALRFNSLLILAVAAQGLGQSAVSDLAVALAILIPLFNIAAIIALTLCPPENPDMPRIARAQALRRITAEILRNPLVLGCALGLALNLSGVELPPWVLSPLDWLGQGALAVGLLTVGAGIQLRRLLNRDPALWVSVGMRLVFCPLLFLALAFVVGLPGGQIASGLLATAAPGASVGYILARQMGGDAEFFADIFTWQTILAAISLPLWLSVGSALAG